LDHEYLLLELGKLIWRTAGLDGRDFIFALLLLLWLRRAAHEVLNPMPEKPVALRVSYEGTKTAKRLYFFTQFG